MKAAIFFDGSMSLKTLCKIPDLQKIYQDGHAHDASKEDVMPAMLVYISIESQQQK